MDHGFLATVGAVLAANILTALFVYGMVQASKIPADSGAPWMVIFAILLPSLFVAVTAYLWA